MIDGTQGTWVQSMSNKLIEHSSRDSETWSVRLEPEIKESRVTQGNIYGGVEINYLSLETQWRAHR